MKTVTAFFSIYFFKFKVESKIFKTLNKGYRAIGGSVTYLLEGTVGMNHISLCRFNLSSYFFLSAHLTLFTLSESEPFYFLPFVHSFSG